MFEKILVCLDGSELSEQIIPFVIEQAKQFNSKVVLVQAIATPSSVPTATGSVSGPALKEQINAQEHKAKNYLSGIALKLGDDGIEVEYSTLKGSPGHSIVDYAHENEVSLIAIATHGHSGIKRAVLGSVADYVIRQSHLPMLVIKPK